MNLREAITKLQNVPLDRPIRWPVEELSLVLAAARAFACEACLGSGIGKEWDYSMADWKPCHECREDREKASGT